MVKLHGAVLPALSSFPDSPTQGRLVFVNDVLYVFTDVDGLDSWYPITNRTRRYVHNQLTGSTAWVVTHDLGTVELLVICYDDSGDLITPTGIAYNTADQITISFGSLIAYPLAPKDSANCGISIAPKLTPEVRLYFIICCSLTML